MRITRKTELLGEKSLPQRRPDFECVPTFWWPFRDFNSDTARMKATFSSLWREAAVVISFEKDNSPLQILTL
jgi:hypothetical protein